ncbi:MAG: hypothetical protein VW405_00665 [Rhodospirillaceae bacterium]
MALERDGNVYVIPLLDELPEMHVMSSDADVTDTGYTYGTAMPGATKRVVSFEGLSGDEEVYPTTSGTTLRRALDYFYSGGSIRVYRNYPSVISEWHALNLDGYDDIVPADSSAAADYPWFADTSFRRFTFKIVGVAQNAD